MVVSMWVKVVYVSAVCRPYRRRIQSRDVDVPTWPGEFLLFHSLVFGMINVSQLLTEF